MAIRNKSSVVGEIKALLEGGPVEQASDETCYIVWSEYQLVVTTYGGLDYASDLWPEISFAELDSARRILDERCQFDRHVRDPLYFRGYGTGQFLGINLTDKKVGILAGSDPDGALAAGIVQDAMINEGIEVVEVRYERMVPLHPKAPALDPNLMWVLVDVPVNGYNKAEDNIVWLREHAERIAKVIDHHLGDEQFVKALGPEKVLTGVAPSCPALLKAQTGVYVPDWVVADANCLDDPTGGYLENADSLAIRAAFDVALVDLTDGQPKTMGRVLRAITSLAPSFAPHAKMVIEFQAGRNELIEKATELVAKQAKVVGKSGGMNVVRAFVPDGVQVAPTSLFKKLYEQAPIAIIQMFGSDGETTVVAHNLGKSGPNLVTVFGMSSGNPSRVPLPGNHAEVMTKIRVSLRVMAKSLTEVATEGVGFGAMADDIARQMFGSGVVTFAYGRGIFLADEVTAMLEEAGWEENPWGFSYDGSYWFPTWTPPTDQIISRKTG